MREATVEAPTPLLWLSYVLGLFVAWRSIEPVSTSRCPIGAGGPAFARAVRELRRGLAVAQARIWQ